MRFSGLSTSWPPAPRAFCAAWCFSARKLWHGLFINPLRGEVAYNLLVRARQLNILQSLIVLKAVWRSSNFEPDPQKVSRVVRAGVDEGPVVVVP